jgi:hypothetical protein
LLWSLRLVSVAEIRLIAQRSVEAEAGEGTDHEGLIQLWSIANRQAMVLVEGTQLSLASRRYVPGQNIAGRKPGIHGFLSSYLSRMGD